MIGYVYSNSEALIITTFQMLTLGVYIFNAVSGSIILYLGLNKLPYYYFMFILLSTFSSYWTTYISLDWIFNDSVRWVRISYNENINWLIHHITITATLGYSHIWFFAFLEKLNREFNSHNLLKKFKPLDLKG